MIEFRYLPEAYARSKCFFENKRMNLDLRSRNMMMCEILDIESTTEQSNKRRYKLEHTLRRGNLLKYPECLLRIECAYRIYEVKVTSASLRPDYGLDICICDSSIECDEFERLECTRDDMPHGCIFFPVFEYCIHLLICREYLSDRAIVELTVSTLPESLAIEIIVLTDISDLGYHGCECLCSFAQ